MINKYKCNSHNLDLICKGCVKAWIARHDQMLDFIKYHAFLHLSDNDIEKMKNDDSLDSYQLGRNRKQANIAVGCRLILKEIGMDK